MQVRPLVEHLLSGGFKVWFAEYAIRLEGCAAFEQAIASGKGDDRENYEYGVQFARDHYSIFPGECIGVYLFFLHGLSHITLTARSTMAWVRKYSVIIPLPDSGQHVEFLFDFYLCSPFEVFCQNTHTMDWVVQSLTWV